MQEYECLLTSGNTIRVSPFAVVITAPDGEQLEELDRANIASVQRTGQTVTVRMRDRQEVTFAATTIDDAGRIEAALQATGTAPVPTTLVVQQKRGGFFRWVGIGCVALLLLGVVVGVLVGVAASRSGSTNADVEYVISTSASVPASVTYTDAGGGIAQETSATLPWHKSLKVKHGTAVSISAQNTSQTDATLTCEIHIDGKVTKMTQSAGPFAVVSCSDLVGL